MSAPTITAVKKHGQITAIKKGPFATAFNGYLALTRALLLLLFYAPAIAQTSGSATALPAKAVTHAASGSSKKLRTTYNRLVQDFMHPPEAAKPWVFWYWMQASVSKAGITADLEAMQAAGIGGAYLMPIKGAGNPPLIDPPVEQLSPAWWKMVRFAMEECGRLGLKLAMHASDGFALAGGPWITPALSMQKLVWTETPLQPGSSDTLPQPQTNMGYYRDIAVLAYPSPAGSGVSTFTVVPEVTTSIPGTDAGALVKKGNTKNFSSEDPCWIQYAFEQPFTCRTITIHTNGNNYQAHRLMVEVSDDGITFRTLGRLQPPRHGWQDTDAGVTHVIAATTARYFRFRYDKAGSEPGAEDLDAAKWKPVLKVAGITLSGEPRIQQYEGKTGEVWRVSNRTTAEAVPDSLCLPLQKIINVTRFMDAGGRLHWQAPAGNWTILRIGHTSTGHTNETGGAGKGLECDKFNPEAITLQFNRWFGEAIRVAGPVLAEKVLKVFHVDSWECGSQNWSAGFSNEFQRRRGYDLLPYLPAMAGVPVVSAGVSERFLHHVRETIAELVVDKFYATLASLAKANSMVFTAESVAPTMTSDGMLHYKAVDVPMGEFWLRSPTHDKPNDMLDAISGAHIYGKPIVQAEAFTELRMAWDEHPAMLKALADRNYALGINRFVFHVFTHNPWLNRKPGMTLDGVGLYFQRDQTWWKPGRAWIAYVQRCQAMLQQGTPVTDIAVFTGEEVPRRAILPDRLVPALPGIFGEDKVRQEAARRANTGTPLQQMPLGVTHSANIADPESWVNPLRGYAYDSFNPDALHLATVKNGRIRLPGGASYALLVLPGAHPLSPDGRMMSAAVAARLLQLVKDGATLLVNERPVRLAGLQGFPAGDDALQSAADVLWGKVTGMAKRSDGVVVRHVGKGRVVTGPYAAGSFDALGLTRDVQVTDTPGNYAANIGFTHRSGPGFDIYFLSNQRNVQRTLEVSLRADGRIPELWDPVTGNRLTTVGWRSAKGRTRMALPFEPNGSCFIVLARPTNSLAGNKGSNRPQYKTIQALEGSWLVSFDNKAGGPLKPVVFDTLADWSREFNDSVRYFSGTATYTHAFSWKTTAPDKTPVWLYLGKVANIASVKLNGIACGIAWTPPYRVNITRALHAGENRLQIEVTNTWANRLIGDHALPDAEKLTNTTAPYRLDGSPLLEAGLLGPVRIVQ